MQDGAIHITGKARTLSLSMALTLLLLLSVLSVRTFLGAYHYGKVPGILDDRSSEESVTVMDVSEETVPAYQDAIRMLGRAQGYDPSRALYRKALADIYARLGGWSKTMELLDAPLPGGSLSSDEAFEHVTTNIREAIRRQPTNPDNHLAYGHISWETNKVAIAGSEYKKTVNAYPWNSSLRYAVVMEYFASGMQEDAQEQARELAGIDDSYKMTESVTMQSAVERRTPYYLRKLSGSYLFKAFEVIWRTSNKDVTMLQGIVPDNDEARDAFEIFLESKDVIGK